VTVTERAPAKVNLFLHVVGRRADGYHLLDSLAVFGPAADTLSAAPARDLRLTVTGPFAPGLAGEGDNLVLRAARALAVAAEVAPLAALTLDKRLPVASGIGGGSADAAATLRALNRLWGCGFATSRLSEIATPLGADVPVCVASRPARMGGVGDVLTASPSLPELGLLLVNPGIPIATPAVFKARTGSFSAPAALPARWSRPADAAASLASLHNDLEAPACALAPVLWDVLATLRGLPGCLLARMSGSGATCFGLFADAAAAARAAAHPSLPSDWWRDGGGLYRPGD